MAEVAALTPLFTPPPNARYTLPMLAYIDPGSGSIILQTLIAAGLGALVFFRDAVKRFLRRIIPGRKSKAPENDERDEEPVSDDRSDP